MNLESMEEDLRKLPNWTGARGKHGDSPSYDAQVGGAVILGYSSSNDDNRSG